jgi:predicted secreted protein
MAPFIFMFAVLAFGRFSWNLAGGVALGFHASNYKRFYLIRMLVHFVICVCAVSVCRLYS